MTTATAHAGLQAWKQQMTREDKQTRAALELMERFNHGRLLSLEMLAAFAVPMPDGTARWDWDGMHDALEGDGPHAPLLAMLSTGERAVARIACDLGMRRWPLGMLDDQASILVAQAVTDAVR